MINMVITWSKFVLARHGAPKKKKHHAKKICASYMHHYSGSPENAQFAFKKSEKKNIILKSWIVF